MRFHADGPAIPDILLERCDAGRVVFLCGAGVSLPSGMPSFIGLTQHVIEFFDPPEESEIKLAFQPWLDDPAGANTPLDQIFNLLHQEYGRDEVNALVTERLNAPLATDAIGREHRLIKRISSNQRGIPQIVTTNFDLLFETGMRTGEDIVHVPPAFPDLAFGTTIEGITYLHGRLADAGSPHHSYILSSADFGRAYLSEGWATNFIRNLLVRYTVVLVGYQAEDPPIKYLLQGLNHDGLYDRSRIYAFDRGVPEEIEVKWRDRGVTAIAYADHSDLWRTMEAWADRADDPRRWRASVISASRQDPKQMAQYERGQVAHVLRTVQGARLFSESNPPPCPEWICVLDTNVRSAKPSSGYGEDAEIFDPRHAYGLDDDLDHFSDDDRKQGVGNDNLVVWRAGDDSPNGSHHLSGLPAVGFEPLPVRLWHLASWVSKSLNSPVMAWWAIRQNGLHSRLLKLIELQTHGSTGLHERARHVWSLILEHHCDPRSRQWDGGWFDLKKRIADEGWTASTLRYFRNVSMPRVAIRPPLGLGRSKPPTGSWDEIRLSDLGQFEVKFFERHNEGLDVPDEALPQVFSILEVQLAVASGLLADVETVYFPTPTCYPDREVDGTDRVADEGVVLTLFVQLFDRIADRLPELAKAYAMTWQEADKYFYRKLKLYAFAKRNVFDANHAADGVLSFDQEAFWDNDVVRELLFLLADRWTDFSPDHRWQLTERILAGPDQREYWSDDKYPAIRDELAARYARYLELQGCPLSDDHRARLASITSGIPRWSDGWAISTVTKRGSHFGWVGTDETPDALLDLPVNEVVARAKEDLARDFGSFTEKRSFTGLVKANPRKALSALTVAGKAGEYPQALWSSMISDLPEDISPRLKRTFLNRLAQLPRDLIAELRHTLGRWLQEKFVSVLDFDDRLGWTVYDHIVDGILSGGADAARSGIGEVRQGGELVERSRRTMDHAINGPLGMCAEALFQAASGEAQVAGSLIPDRIKSRVARLLVAPGEGGDHVVSITMRRLNWIIYVDPIWTKELLLPMLAFDHPASEPAWNGFLHSGDVPGRLLTALIKPLLLGLFPWIYSFSWNRELSEIAGQWLGWMRVFRPDQPSGLMKREMRSVLRLMSDSTRRQFIFWLGMVGQKNENGWVKLVIPFINDVWPRERQFRTSASMRNWVGLLDDTGDDFPAVYGAVKRFLVPVETNDHPFYRFTREIDGEKSITERFPEATLDLMDAVTPLALTRPPYELPKVLNMIAEAVPELTSDPRYLRLIDLVERS